MPKKKRFEYVLGFDECLNGFKVQDRHEPFIVMVGYLGRDGRGYGTAPFGSKQNRNFLGKKRSSLEEVLRCARPFLDSHQTYRYVVIPEKKAESQQKLLSLKAESIALMTYDFFKSNPCLNHQNTTLYIDETDGRTNSQYLNTVLSYLLEKSGLENLTHRSIRKGEDAKEVIKIADMVAYYLASIKLISKSKRWPHRTKRLHL